MKALVKRIRILIRKKMNKKFQIHLSNTSNLYHFFEPFWTLAIMNNIVREINRCASSPDAVGKI